MCSINGFLSFDDSRGTPETLHGLGKFFEQATNRGRDSYGFYFNSERGLDEENFELTKDVSGNPFEHEPGKETFDVNWEEVRICLNNMRAEPTSNSDWIREKTIDDTQPICSLNAAVVHNGTICNDDEIEYTKDMEFIGINGDLLYTTKTKPRIDSGVFLTFTNADKLIDALRKDKIKGSYALAQHFYESGLVLFAKNYMPLYFLFDYENKWIWFASEKETFEPILLYITGDYEIYDFPAYSAAVINLNEEFEDAVDLIKNFASDLMPEIKTRKALCVCSGGLDSATLTTMMVRELGPENVKMLHFRYNCKAQAKEEIAVKNISLRLGIELEIIDMGDIFSNFLSSPLTTDGATISEGDIGIEYANEWVPARNLILMSIAIGYAEKNGFNELYLGANLDESAAYPDNSVDFIDKLNTLIPYSVQNGVRLEIKKPLANMMKHEIVKKAIEIDAPLDLMWSCYHDGNIHCGECGPCNLRKIAFAKNGIEDTFVRYEK